MSTSKSSHFRINNPTIPLHFVEKRAFVGGERIQKPDSILFVISDGENAWPTQFQELEEYLQIRDGEGREHGFLWKEVNNGRGSRWEITWAGSPNVLEDFNLPKHYHSIGTIYLEILEKLSGQGSILSLGKDLALRKAPI